MDYEQQLLQIYRENPCRTLPNAFWKTASQMENSRLSIRRNDAGDLSALALWQEAKLMAFWTGDPGKHPLTPRQVSKVAFALVHEATMPIFGTASIFIAGNPISDCFTRGRCLNTNAQPVLFSRMSIRKPKSMLLHHLYGRATRTWQSAVILSKDGSITRFLRLNCGYGLWMKAPASPLVWGLLNWIGMCRRYLWSGSRFSPVTRSKASVQRLYLSCCAEPQRKPDLPRLQGKLVQPEHQKNFTGNAAFQVQMFGGF